MSKKVHIVFDPCNLEDCWYAICWLSRPILTHHDPAMVRDLFAAAVPFTKRRLQQAKNNRLLAEYIRSGLSIKKCAAILAERNRALPRDYRYGPNGTTNAETMEKQIRRQKKLISQDGRRHKYIRRTAGYLARYGTESRSQPPGDVDGVARKPDPYWHRKRNLPPLPVRLPDIS
jgi:hypothetical protein